MDKSLIGSSKAFDELYSEWLQLYNLFWCFKYSSWNFRVKILHDAIQVVPWCFVLYSRFYGIV